MVYAIHPDCCFLILQTRFYNLKLFSLSNSTVFVNQNLWFSVMNFKGPLWNSKSPELDSKFSIVCLLRQKLIGLTMLSWWGKVESKKKVITWYGKQQLIYWNNILLPHVRKHSKEANSLSYVLLQWLLNLLRYTKEWDSDPRSHIQKLSSWSHSLMDRKVYRNCLFS